ncbi:MAG: peptidoglycan bridge formation glycyltransferase FemA/FemB family protein [Dehalococcoidia bacterium]|nr:peptidoglycan bridge formation glycyltransferase FemA/FemB family protein [Dehalococcoidia bacterium]
MPRTGSRLMPSRRRLSTQADTDVARKYRVETEVDASQWGDFVRTHPAGSIFQTPQMQAVYGMTRGYTPRTLFAVDASTNRLSGVMASVVIRVLSGPLGLLSARTIVQNGPLIAPGCERDIMQLLLPQHDASARRRSMYTELWNLRESEVDRCCQCGYVPARHLEIVADLSPSEAQLWAGLSSRRRRSVLRAMRHGVAVCCVAPGDSLIPFYRTLQATYERRRLPLADITLFNAAQRQLGESGQVRFLIATLNHRVVSSKVLLTYGTSACAWYAGSSQEGQEAYANDLLGWEAMLWSRATGCDRFDFGGAGSPDIDYGPRAFKLQFGGQLMDSVRMTKTYLPALRRFSSVGFKLYCRMRYSRSANRTVSVVQDGGECDDATRVRCDRAIATWGPVR